MQLITHNIPGNLHESATWINQSGFAGSVVHLHYISGSGFTIAVFRVKDAVASAVRDYLRQTEAPKPYGHRMNLDVE